MQQTTTSAHPFELSGMGRGPFRFIGTYEMPNLSEDSAENFANSNPYADAPKLIGGCGTCANCGMAISNICIVENADGGRYGVGCDCVEKTGDKSLGDMAKIAVAKIRQRKARAAADKRRADQQAQWDASTSKDSRAYLGETNAQFRARLAAQQAAEKFAEDAKNERRAAMLKPLADVIRDGCAGFCDSIANDMARGFIPSGRGLNLAIDIYAKRFGRRNSNAYEAANAEACGIIESAQAI